MPAIQLKASGQFQCAPHTAVTKMLACASLQAQPLADDKQRKPIDLTVVLDRSGSMGGDKLRLCLATIDFLTEQLGVNDRLGLVTFDTTVTCNWPMLKMDAKGKLYVQAAVRKIHAGSMTNLSGGLLEGIEELKRGSANGNGNEVKSLMLLTDGLANHGVTDSNSIVRMLKSVLDSPGMEKTSVCTFGYGKSHNQDMLRAISDAGNGVYYFVEEIDDVPVAFADCLGGLLSVVGQNIKLRIEVPDISSPSSTNSATILKVHTKKKVVEIVPRKVYEVSVGDMFAEEERDILVEMSLPRLTAPTPPQSSAEAVLQCNVRYVDVIEGKMRGREDLPQTGRLPTASAQASIEVDAEALANAAGEDEGVAMAEGMGENMVLVSAHNPSSSNSPTGSPTSTSHSSPAPAVPERAAAVAAAAECSEAIVRVARHITGEDAGAGADLADNTINNNVSCHITRQWARIRSAEAMDAARDVASKGQYAQGVEVLEDALGEVEKAREVCKTQIKKEEAKKKNAKKEKKDTRKEKGEEVEEGEKKENNTVKSGDGADVGAGADAGEGAGTGAEYSNQGPSSQESPSSSQNQNHQDGDALLANLAAQLSECRSDMQQSQANERHWHTKGKYTMCNFAQGHHQQRSNCSKAAAPDSVGIFDAPLYRGITKQAMCATTFSSESIGLAKQQMKRQQTPTKARKNIKANASSAGMQQQMQMQQQQMQMQTIMGDPNLMAELNVMEEPMQQQQHHNRKHTRSGSGSGGMLSSIMESLRMGGGGRESQ